MDSKKQQKLSVVKEFFEEQIMDWMLGDLKRSIGVDTNFLSALGCLVYTEVIGIFLPCLEKKEGSKLGSKYFYRCLFRLKSKSELIFLENSLRQRTGKGFYDHLRHNMAHRYIPIILKSGPKRIVGTYIPSLVTKRGAVIGEVSGKIARSAPIFVNKDGRVVIAVLNYVEELEMAVDDFYRKIFVDKDPEYTEAAIKGIDYILN